MPLPLPFPSSCLAQKSGGDVAHVSLLQSIVHAIILVNADIVKSLDHIVEVEAHVDETVNEILVPALVSAIIMFLSAARRGDFVKSPRGIQEDRCVL